MIRWPYSDVPAERLLERARDSRRNAYAPYSHFQVGAALLTEEGNIVCGCNVENSSYGLTLCAERNAIAHAVLSGAGMPIAIAVVGMPGDPCYPCGACRQVLYEFNVDMLLVFENGDDIMIHSLRDFLPYGFSLAER